MKYPLAEMGLSPYDEPIGTIADYAVHARVTSSEAYSTARLCLLDAIGCALLALNFPACTRVIGRSLWSPEPVRAAFQLGTAIRWLDYNDTWLAAEWGHPSDNFGGLLAIADFLCRNGRWVTIRDVLHAAVKAYEIQGVLALGNSFNRLGFDHVILVRVATAAMVTQLLGGDAQQVAAAQSQAWIDGASLRCYRQAPSAGSRKSWAAGDATSRGVFLALLAREGEMGYPRALTAKQWGFNDVVLRGGSLILPRPLGSYVMENILFKVAFPAEFHAQTAVECAIGLHPFVRNRWDDIASILITTHDSACRIIDKQGPLVNPADRDHCLQYMVAIGLLFGHLTADHYEDAVARDPRIDRLRHLMSVVENPQFSRDYLDPDKRSIANGLVIRFRDGTSTPPQIVEYPMGHRRRRSEAIPLLLEKFKHNASQVLLSERVETLIELFQHPDRWDNMPVSVFLEHLRTPEQKQKYKSSEIVLT